MYPVDRAVIILAVCAPELAGRRLTVEGRRIVVAVYARVALLLAFVDRYAYAPAAVERLRADPSWLAAEARLLEVAVERVSLHGDVVPMRLLTVVSNVEALETIAREQSRAWSRALARLATKRECVVHLFIGPHVPPGGDPYVLRIAGRAVKTGRLVLKGQPEAVVDHVRSVWRMCVEGARATRRLPTANDRGALWSGVVLLEESAVATFAVAFTDGAAAGLPLGISAYLEPPRPPFSFV